MANECAEKAQAGRRKMLGMLASGAALAGLNATPALAAPPSPAAAGEADELFAQARLRSYKTRRSSSWDRTGGNDDSVHVESGASATILEVPGAGVVTHLWFTINSPDPHHLKNLVLRACGTAKPRPRSRYPSATSSASAWASTTPTNPPCSP